MGRMSFFSSPELKDQVNSFLIAFCPSSVCFLSVNFPHFIFSRNAWQISTKLDICQAFLGEGGSSLFKWRITFFSKGSLLQNYFFFFKLTNFNQTWHKASFGGGTQGFRNKDHSFLFRVRVRVLLKITMLAFLYKIIAKVVKCQL